MFAQGVFIGLTHTVIGPGFPYGRNQACGRTGFIQKSQMGRHRVFVGCAVACQVESSDSFSDKWCLVASRV